MSKILLATPVLIDREKRLTGCLEGMFSQTMVKNENADVYVIVNNSDDQPLIDQVDKFEDGYLIVNEENFGVSGSWNQAILEARNNGYKYACLCGYDTYMTEENLLQDFYDAMEKEGADFGRGKGMSFNFWMVNVQTFPDKIGYFDENFYPAYWEDIDMMRRIRTARDKGYIKTLKFVEDGRISHHQSTTINDHKDIFPHDMWNFTYTNNQLYLRAKWGTDEDNHEKGYKTPFNDPVLHNSFWFTDRVRKAKAKEMWDQCIKDANVTS